MSFSRLSYDSCAYSKSMQQSTDPLDYYLYKGKFEACEKCSVGDFTNNLDFGSRSDIESELKGQTRIGSKCQSDKFQANNTINVPFTPALMCQNNLTQINTGYPSVPASPLIRPQDNGLKPFSSYMQNSTCAIKK